MTRPHALALALLALASIASAYATGELMDVSDPATTCVGLGIAAGTFATCGFLAMFGKLLERGTL